MSKARLVTAAVAPILALACMQTTEPIEGRAEGPAPQLGATQFMTHFTIPVDELFPAPCANGGAGEDIRITGTNMIWIKETITPRGNRILRIHLKPEIAGVGETSGEVYRAGRSPGQIMEIEQPDGLPFITTVFPQPIILIGRGASAATILIYTRFQLVINHNGVPTVQIEDFSARCQGPGL